MQEILSYNDLLIVLGLSLALIALLTLILLLNRSWNREQQKTARELEKVSAEHLAQELDRVKLLDETIRELNQEKLVMTAEMVQLKQEKAEMAAIFDVRVAQAGAAKPRGKKATKPKE